MTNISESSGSYRLFSSSTNSENKKEVSSEKEKNHLPVEITHNILNYLSPKTLANVAKTCKVGNQFVENALIWKKLGFINKDNGEDAIRNDRGEATHKAVADAYLKTLYSNLAFSERLSLLQKAVKSGKIAKKVSIPTIEDQFRKEHPELAGLVPAGLLTQEELDKLKGTTNDPLSDEKTVHFTAPDTWMGLACIDERPDIQSFLSVPDEYISAFRSTPLSTAEFLAKNHQDKEKKTRAIFY